MTTVIFRKFKDGEIVALFPYEIEGVGKVLDYMHVGQHGSSNYNYVVSITKPASKEEYQDLYNELVRIGYELDVKRKRNFDKYRKAYYEKYV